MFYLFILCLFPFDKIDLEQQYSRLFKLGDETRLEGDFKKSIELFEDSLSVAKNIPDEKKECESLIRLGLLYWNIGKLNDSSNYYQQALDIANKLNLKNFQEECHNARKIYNLYKKAKSFRDSCEYQKSIESFHEAVDLSRKVGSKEHEVKCLRQLSYSYGELNKLQDRDRKMYASNGFLLFKNEYLF